MAPDHDDNLVASYLAGDVAAFDELFERHRRGLFSYLYSMVGSREDTEDLFQETFLRAIAALPRYRARGRFRAWLYRIARNLARDRIRGLRLKGVPVTVRTINRDEAESRRIAFDIADGRRNPRDAAAGREEQDRIHRAIENLPAPQKEVFVLREYAGMPFREIAEVQRCPLGTVLARMHYALDKLRAQLQEEE